MPAPIFCSIVPSRQSMDCRSAVQEVGLYAAGLCPCCPPERERHMARRHLALPTETYEEYTRRYSFLRLHISDCPHRVTAKRSARSESTCLKTDHHKEHTTRGVAEECPRPPKGKARQVRLCIPLACLAVFSVRTTYPNSDS